MKILPKSFSCLILSAMMLMAVCSCAHEPFDPPETDEIPKGPGLFTKEGGSAVLFDSKKQKGSAPATAIQAPAGEQAPGPGETPEAYEDFEAYQQWLEWKSSNTDSEAYQEFKQWQEWRRYQEWKKKK